MHARGDQGGALIISNCRKSESKSRRAEFKTRSRPMRYARWRIYTWFKTQALIMRYLIFGRVSSYFIIIYVYGSFSFVGLIEGRAHKGARAGPTRTQGRGHKGPRAGPTRTQGRAQPGLEGWPNKGPGKGPRAGPTRAKGTAQQGP